MTDQIDKKKKPIEISHNIFFILWGCTYTFSVVMFSLTLELYESGHLDIYIPLLSLFAAAFSLFSLKRHIDIKNGGMELDE